MGLRQKNKTRDSYDRIARAFASITVRKSHNDNDIDANQANHDNRDDCDNRDNCVNHDIRNIVGRINYCLLLDDPSLSIVYLSLLVVDGQLFLIHTYVQVFYKIILNNPAAL